jgi:prolipoprotein diacylglyceryltransferase
LHILFFSFMYESLVEVLFSFFLMPSVMCIIYRNRSGRQSGSFFHFLLRVLAGL